jgi:hypothetical protein
MSTLKQPRRHIPRRTIAPSMTSSATRSLPDHRGGEAAMSDRWQIGLLAAALIAHVYALWSVRYYPCLIVLVPVSYVLIASWRSARRRRSC